MNRHSFSFMVKKGKVGEFLSCFGTKWSLVKEELDRADVSNFSMWNCEQLFFGYYESQSETPSTKEIMASVACCIEKYCEWVSDFTKDMKLMYEDFGVVRDDKSMIRHRVFMTHLIHGEREEYKRRHDELVAARTEVDPGPDSNFSIWNSGDYIFGYDEVDTSMEHEMTEAEREDTVKWEKHMLDIMEWITDDVDWITGMHHEHIKRVAWYR